MDRRPEDEKYVRNEEGPVQSLIHQAHQLIEHYGLAALFISLTLEAFGLPAPGESAMILASALAVEGQFSVLGVFVSAWLGAVLGNTIGYAIGRHFGAPAMLAHGARLGLTTERFEKLKGALHRHGIAVLIGARFLPVARQTSGMIAGVAGVPWLLFVLADSASAAIWVGFWTYLAYSLGSDTEVMPYLFHHVRWVIAIVVLPVLITFVILGFRQRRVNVSSTKRSL